MITSPFLFIIPEKEDLFTIYLLMRLSWQEAFLQEDVLAVSIGKRFVKGDLTLKHSLCSHFKISHNLNILIYYNKSIWIEFFYDFSQRMVFSLGHNG